MAQKPKIITCRDAIIWPNFCLLFGFILTILTSEIWIKINFLNISVIKSTLYVAFLFQYWTSNRKRLDFPFCLFPTIYGNAESATSWFMMNSLEYHDIDLGIISHTWHMRLITRMIIKILSDLKHLKILCYRSCGSFYHTRNLCSNKIWRNNTSFYFIILVRLNMLITWRKVERFFFQMNEFL